VAFQSKKIAMVLRIVDLELKMTNLRKQAKFVGLVVRRWRHQEKMGTLELLVSYHVRVHASNVLDESKCLNRGFI
jgi:hypothetical protein